MGTSTVEDVRSERIRRFAEAIASGDSTAVPDLVADLEKARGPLIERLDDDHWLVTFVYVGPAERVALESHVMLTVDGDRPAMRKVPGASVWHLSLVVDDDQLVVTYCFLVDSEFGGRSMHEVEAVAQTEEGHRRFAADRVLSSRHDPFNPERIRLDGRAMFAHDPEVLALVEDEAELERWDSVLRMPGAETTDLLGPAGGSPRELRLHTIPSGVFGDEREITVWTPPGGLHPGVRYSLLLLLDGQGATAAGLPEILANLSAAGLIRPTIGAFVHNKNSWSRSEEMVCNPKIVTHYADEILPWLRSHYPVTDNPARTVVSGGSYGGLGSSWLAYRRPDLFGNVLSMSGSYWWGLRTAWGAPKDSGVYGFDDEPEWLTRQYAATPRLPIRFWISVGTLEKQHLPGGITMLAANRTFRSVLRARDYDVHFEEFHGGHDKAGWRGVLVRGLPHLLGNPER